MKTLSFAGELGGSEIVFLLMLAQFGLAIWLSYRCYRTEPHWKTLSVLGCLLLPGLPGFLVVRAIRSGFRGYFEGRTGVVPPEGR